MEVEDASSTNVLKWALTAVLFAAGKTHTWTFTTPSPLSQTGRVFRFRDRLDIRQSNRPGQT
jgi:hypothetical protein